MDWWYDHYSNEFRWQAIECKLNFARSVCNLNQFIANQRCSVNVSRYYCGCCCCCVKLTISIFPSSVVLATSTMSKIKVLILNYIKLISSFYLPPLRFEILHWLLAFERFVNSWWSWNRTLWKWLALNKWTHAHTTYTTDCI